MIKISKKNMLLTAIIALFTYTSFSQKAPACTDVTRRAFSESRSANDIYHLISTVAVPAWAHDVLLKHTTNPDGVISLYVKNIANLALFY